MAVVVPKKIILPNGIRCILVPQEQSVAASVLILVEAGSEYESKRVNGISHFLEHLVFKGTTKRPQVGKIAEELDALGAEYNAFTGQEYTGYWAKAEHRKLAHIFELISDLYLNPIFNPEEIEKERGVIIEEINMYEDTPMRRAQELFGRALYGDQPAGWDIAGEKETVRRITREEVIRYRAAHYVPGATVVVVAGNFDTVKVAGEIRKTFGVLSRAPKKKKPRTRTGKPAMRVLTKFKKSDQTHLVLGVPAYTVFDKRRYALEVLANVIGGGMSSRLFRKIREELGAAYYVRAGADLSADHGHFAVSVGADHAKVPTVVKAILAELVRLQKEPVGAKELLKAKDHLIGGLFLGVETSDELASFYGGQEIITRKLERPEAVARQVAKVSADDIRRVARELFKNSMISLSAIGPYRTGAVFSKLLRLPPVI
ncbi:MAG: insulinase family protein [Candidatus Liptonbacteria bacterium]|nr:insulinase family protein [Candidatus Liptonbacteria bacterium]